MEKKGILFGIVITVFGLLITIGPQTFWHVCRSDGDMRMPCFYTARAELAIGIGIAILGIVFALSKSQKAKQALSIAVGLSGIYAFIVPNWLIGVCGAEHMHCHAVTKPAVSLVSIALIVLAIVSYVVYLREGVKEDDRTTVDDHQVGNTELKEETA